MKRKVVVVSDSEALFGGIEILKLYHDKAYVQWTVVDKEHKLFASFTNDYHFGSRKIEEDEIFELIRKQMLNYRISRRKVFSSVEFARDI